MKDEYQRHLDAMSEEEWEEYQSGQLGPDDAAAMDRAYPPPPTDEELDRMGREFFERFGELPF